MTTPVTLIQYVASNPGKIMHGRTRWLLHLVRHARLLGWRTYCVMSDRTPRTHPVSQAIRAAGGEMLRVPRPQNGLRLRDIRSNAAFLRGLQGDILHCHNIHSAPLLAARIARIPVRIWSKRSMSPYAEEGVAPRGWHRWAPTVRFSCLLSHRVLAVSNAVASEMRSLGVVASKVNVLHNMIEEQRGSSVDRMDMRARLQCAHEDFILVTVGHAVPVKGWDVLVKAFRKTVLAVPRARLLLVGSYDEPHEKETYEQLRGLVRDLGIGNRVRFLGPRADVAEILAACDLFVFPSRMEGFGRALGEAMAAGLPCMATGVGGIHDIVSHGVNGLLFERENASDLAAKAIALAHSPAWRRSLSRAGRMSARRFDAASHIEALFSLYRKLLYAKAPDRAERALA